MSEHIEKTHEEITKTTTGKPSEELNDKDLETVSGGINPQPLPPSPMRRS